MPGLWVVQMLSIAVTIAGFPTDDKWAVALPFVVSLSKLTSLVALASDPTSNA